MPGVLTAGTFRQEGERIFWDVHDGTNAVVVALEHYAQRFVDRLDIAFPGHVRYSLKASGRRT